MLVAFPLNDFDKLTIRMPLIESFSFLDITKLRQPFRSMAKDRGRTNTSRENTAIPWELTEQKGLGHPSFGSLSPDKGFLQQDRP